MHNVFKINAVYPHSRITARARKKRAKQPKQRYIVAIFVFFELSNSGVFFAALIQNTVSA